MKTAENIVKEIRNQLKIMKRAVMFFNNIGLMMIEKHIIWESSGRAYWEGNHNYPCCYRPHNKKAYEIYADFSKEVKE